MFHDDYIAGSWPDLVARLDRDAAIKSWSLHEPALVGLESVAELVRLTSRGADWSRADCLLGALVRTGSVHGGGDADAVLVVLHLLAPGVAALASTIGDLSSDPVGLVIGELTVRIRSFRIGPRGGSRDTAIAWSLIQETRRVVLREARPHRTPKRPKDADLLVDPTNLAHMLEVFDQTIPGPGDSEGCGCRQCHPVSR